MTFVTEAWMITGQRNPEADKWKQWVRQPVHPSQTLFRPGVGKQPIHPNVKELIQAETRNVIRLERTVFQIATADVVVSLKRSDAPTDWTVSQHRSGCPVRDRNDSFAQLAEPSIIALSRKRCSRAL